MVSHLTSRKLTFVDASGCVLEEPIEWATATMQLPVPIHDFEKATVTLQNEALAIYVSNRFGSKAVFADWPRRGPGNYAVVLKAPEITFETTITVRPKKMSSDAFFILIDELQNLLPTSIVLGLKRTGAFADVELRSPNVTTLAQEMIRLRRAVIGNEECSGLLSILQSLATRYNTRLKAEELSVPWDKARRPHPARILQFVASGSAKMTLDGFPDRVPDHRVEVSADTQENRLVKYFVLCVFSRINTLTQGLNPRQFEFLSNVVF